jgi:hypothetical protein
VVGVGGIATLAVRESRKARAGHVDPRQPSSP